MTTDMRNSGKELEEKIIEAGHRLQKIPPSVDDLLPLLDQLESLLSRVEQSPTKSMLAALNPAISSLISKELLEIVDINVSIGVTTCISEITRITAPEAPYDDDLMKEIFQRIVQSFKNLDDMSSSLYPKRVSILETVAKVRSCVVMLDLECDSLILDMFHYFLNTIRDSHPESVVSSMEMIMTLVLEESEDISPDLLSCLLMNVKKDNKDILPVARTLAEKIIKNCALKLKPCLMEAVDSIGAPLTNYSNIVATVCQQSSDVLEHLNGVKADENAAPEREISGVTQQGLGKPDSEEAQTVTEKSTTPLLNNGTVPTVDGSSTGELTLPKTKSQRSQRRRAFSPDEPNDGLNQKARRVKSQQRDKEEDSSLPTRRRRGRGRGRISREESKPDRLEKSTDNSSAADSAPRKRGRPSGDRSSRKRKENDDLPINGNSAEKKHEDFDDLEKKPLKDLARRLLQDGGVSRKFRSKMNRDSTVTNSEEKPRKKRGRKPKNIVEAETPAKEKNDTGVSEINLKEPVSSPRAAGEADKDQAVSEESSQKRRRKKRSPGEGSELIHDAIPYDDTLVGVKVKVWWPDDKRFYAGMVESYDPTTMKHKILYNDGDEEELVLKNEILKFRKGTKLGLREKVGTTPESTSETVQRKRRRMGSESLGRKSKLTGSLSERRDVDGSGSTPISGKKRGRRPKSMEATPSGGTVSRVRKSIDSSQPRRRQRSGGATAGVTSGRGGRRRGRRPKDSTAAEDGVPTSEVSKKKDVDGGDDAEAVSSEIVVADEEAGGKKSGKK